MWSSLLEASQRLSGGKATDQASHAWPGGLAGRGTREEKPPERDQSLRAEQGRRLTVVCEAAPIRPHAVDVRATLSRMGIPHLGALILVRRHDVPKSYGIVIGAGRQIDK